jgi:hypothetical protein
MQYTTHKIIYKIYLLQTVQILKTLFRLRELKDFLVLF